MQNRFFVTGRAFSTMIKKAITKDTIPDNVSRAQYAVRGEVVTRSWDVEKMLHEHPEQFDFKKLTACNIGNPQACGAQPFDYYRQLLALCTYPELLNGDVSQFPKDVVERARRYMASGLKTGAYSHSKGIEVLRQDVATWMSERDGYPVESIESVFLTDGASTGIKSALDIIVGGPKDAVLIPIPQYPLYSASITKLGGTWVGYYLDEKNGWTLDMKELRRALKDARDKGLNVKAICVINPGNPTGAVLPEADVEHVLRLAQEEGLAVLADEVYQENIYNEQKPFVSFRSVLKKHKLQTELFSFHSASKGLAGECGLRGGVMQIENLTDAAAAELYKLSSLSLCANVPGQVVMAAICRGPQPGDASYESFTAEKKARLQSLKERSHLVNQKLNAIKGIHCQPADGAMYAFPSIQLPKAAIDAAKAAGKAPDLFYSLKCLEATGMIVVPGSGFGQVEGTYHFRTTILPPREELEVVFDAFKTFHEKFVAQYGGY